MIGYWKMMTEFHQIAVSIPEAIQVNAKVQLNLGEGQQVIALFCQVHVSHEGRSEVGHKQLNSSAWTVVQSGCRTTQFWDMNMTSSRCSMIISNNGDRLFVPLISETAL